MKSIFERVKIQHKMHLPFVVYRKPNAKTLVGIFQENDHLYFTEDFSQRGFVFAPFSGSAIVFPFEKAEVKYNSVYFENDFADSFKESSTEEFLKESFQSLVHKGIQTIKDGVISKIVLSRAEQVKLDDFDLFTVFEKILYKYATAFCYCWYHPKIGLWIGATPERLFSAKERVFRTMSLAGTQAYHGTESVSWKSKEVKEQEIVTDFILDKLKPETSTIQASEAYTVKAGNLLHLRTDIEGELNPNANLKNVLAILHPTPAVCGLPKDLSKAFIETHEGYDREYYSGFLGEINCDFNTNEHATDLFVNLRCMKVNVEVLLATLYVGCGVTKDSVPEAEWEETRNKAKTMLHVL